MRIGVHEEDALGVWVLIRQRQEAGEEGLGWHSWSTEGRMVREKEERLGVVSHSE